MLGLGLLGIITLTAIGILTFVVLITTLFGMHWLSKTPKQTVDAAVRDKHTSLIYDKRDGADDYSNTSTEYCMSFQTNAGEYIDLNVPKRDYERYNVGDGGELTYKGGEFVRFKCTVRAPK